MFNSINEIIVVFPSFIILSKYTINLDGNLYRLLVQVSLNSVMRLILEIIATTNLTTTIISWNIMKICYGKVEKANTEQNI